MGTFLKKKGIDLIRSKKVSTDYLVNWLRVFQKLSDMLWEETNLVNRTFSSILYIAARGSGIHT